MLTFADAFEKIFEMPNPVFVFGSAIAVVGIIGGTATKILVSRGREKTRREIAAYVAEGTMDPDKAIQLLEAGEKANSDSCC